MPQQNYPDKTKINVDINYSTLVFGLAFTTLSLIAAYLISTGVGKILEFRDYISIFTTGVVCTSLFYHSKNVKLTHRYHTEKLLFEKEKHQKENERKIAEYSLMICSEWFRPGVGEHAHRSRLFINANKPITNAHEFIIKLNASFDDRKAISGVLNYFEHISLLIKKGLVDESIIKEAFKTLFCDYFITLKPFIVERQKASRRYLINYEELAEKWAKDY